MEAMPKNIELKDIVEKNPRVSLDKLEEGRELRKNLQRPSGTKRRHLIFPVDRKRVRIDDDVASDPRAIRLQRSGR